MSAYGYGEKRKHDAVELADFGNRFFALVIDYVILGVITGILVRGAGGPGAAGSFLINFAYYWYFLTQHDGQTLGKRLMGVRVVRANGEPLDFVTVLIRYVGYYINSFFFMLGWIWALFDDQRQGWHDKLANTYVIRA